MEVMQEELKAKLDAHKLWLETQDSGVEVVGSSFTKRRTNDWQSH